MKTTGRPLALAFAALLVLGSCTGGGTDGQTGPSGATAGTGATGETGPTPAQTFSGPPGTAVYSYANAGLEVELDIDGNEGTLEVDNGTGRELPPPGFYLLDARDGSRIDGEVTDPAPIPDGRTAAFDVSFTGVEVRNIGLVILLLGQDNYGAFVRTG
ncbi:MAG TPA: hypothetical protein VE669_00115 [Actinomycetota bacterium]|nr:hypothetical protein [Actinomycetota bacterium]